MKNYFGKSISVLLVVAVVLSMVSCSPKPSVEYNAPALVQSLLAQVAFDDTLSGVGDSAALYFPDLPEGAVIELYTGSGYYADEVALVTLKSEADAKKAKASVEEHIAQLRSQFASYIPEEVGKIDNAVVWEGGKYFIVCITNDYASAKLILDHADDPDYKLPGNQDSSTPESTSGTETKDPAETSDPTDGTTEPSQPTEPSVTAPTETTPPETTGASAQTRPDGYPAITSQSGTYTPYAGTSMIRVDNSAFEVCGYSDSVAATYAQLVSKVADALAGKTTVYSLAIPTSFGVMLPDDIQAIYDGYTNQGESIDKVFAKMSSNVVPVRCFDKLMSHRNEYLYFRTDHHWNGRGAYYAYEAFCQAKGITPYTLAQREEKQFGDFLGSLYINAGNDQALLPADTVYAYKPYCSSASMVFYDKNGTETKWSIIADVTSWGQGSKYSTFAGADNPLAVFTNPEVTDGSVCIVVKESYGNALLPYLVDHYSTVYEIDYRYWTGDLVTFAQEKGADDMIFANNIMMISTGLLVGMLGDNIQ